MGANSDKRWWSLGRAASVACLGLMMGCASPQTSGISSCEQEKAELLATIRTQREEVNSLRDKTASLERRLAESETEIARIDPTRQARRTASASPDDGLPWRPPTEVATDKSESPARR